MPQITKAGAFAVGSAEQSLDVRGRDAAEAQAAAQPFQKGCLRTGQAGKVDLGFEKLRRHKRRVREGQLPEGAHSGAIRPHEHFADPGNARQTKVNEHTATLDPGRCSEQQRGDTIGHHERAFERDPAAERKSRDMSTRDCQCAEEIEYEPRQTRNGVGFPAGFVGPPEAQHIDGKDAVPFRERGHVSLPIQH